MIFLLIVTFFTFLFQPFLVVVVADVLSAQQVAQQDLQQVAKPVSTVTLKNITFVVEIADDDAERAMGLMYREQLAKNHGMFFIFPNEEPRTFWMKNTLIPLDMIFADASGKIVKIQKDAVPCQENQERKTSDGDVAGELDQSNCPLYASQKSAKYVLEINGGLSTKMKLREGEKLALDGI